MTKSHNYIEAVGDYLSLDLVAIIGSLNDAEFDAFIEAGNLCGCSNVSRNISITIETLAEFDMGHNSLGRAANETRHETKCNNFPATIFERFPFFDHVQEFKGHRKWIIVDLGERRIIVE